MSDRWLGWSDTGPPRAVMPAGPWLDLTHPLREGMSQVSFLPRPRFEQIFNRPAHPMSVTEIQMACHVGTHVDSPRHFIADGPTMEQVPLDRLCGPGVVWRVNPPPYGLIQAGDLRAAVPRLERGDIVFLDTGWAALFGTEEYDQNPSLSADAAEWLFEQGAKIVGIDCATVDLAVKKRSKGFDWPVHHTLLSHGVLVVEHLANLRPLAGRRIEAMVFGLPIVGADGSPARVIARAVEG